MVMGISSIRCARMVMGMSGDLATAHVRSLIDEMERDFNREVSLTHVWLEIANFLWLFALTSQIPSLASASPII